METTLTINIPAPSARARGAGVGGGGGGGGGGGEKEKIKVCFKTLWFFTQNLAAPTSLPNRLSLKRSLLIKTSYYSLCYILYDIFIQFFLDSIKRGRNMTK
jgi:hypothetical protein